MLPGAVASARNRRALDLLSFFLADVQTGFGPFIAVYLTAEKWTELQIGLALTLGTVTALAAQVPAGALVDAVRSKRRIAAAGILGVTASALLLALWPRPLPVYGAELLHGIASCVVNPAIAAISLRLVGHMQFGERLGRNARFASIGNGLAAACMGTVGSTLSNAAVFWLTALLTLPALLALAALEPASRETRAEIVRRPDAAALWALFADRRVLTFAAAVLLFQLSDAAMLPLMAASVTARAGSEANLLVAACIVVPQGVVALLAPWVGRAADGWGRRPVLLLGWGMQPLRALLIALLPPPWLLVGIQLLGGISAAVFGVMLALMASDLTRQSGRFNLCMGALGLAVFGGASLSTTAAGWLADAFGESAAFLGLAAAGAAGTLVIWLGVAAGGTGPWFRTAPDPDLVRVTEDV